MISYQYIENLVLLTVVSYSILSIYHNIVTPLILDIYILIIDIIKKCVSE